MRRAAPDAEMKGIGVNRRLRERIGGMQMKFEKEDIKANDKNLDRMAEKLSDALSLVIILENNMEIQKSDCIHVRILRMVHESLKGIQRSLSEYIGQEEE